MKPERNSDIIQTPLTFDVKGGGRIESEKVSYLWLFLIILFWVFSSIFIGVAAEGFLVFIYPFVSFFLLSYIVRFILFREIYFKNKRKELIENEYLYNHDIFWNIYDIDNNYPYICSFKNGKKGVFVAFDKDVIVGKDSDYDYNHYEAISNAYQFMLKRGIEAIHIDYMDVVGKDDRLEGLFERANRTKNNDLKKLVIRMYDYIEFTMNRTYASYDVYCFYSSYRSDLFWDDLQSVLEQFKQANYIRTRVLNKDDIGLLVKSLINIEEFSVNKAIDSVFKKKLKTNYINPIWVEKDGNKTILNKTFEELENESRIKLAEKKVKKKSIFSRSNKNEDINLFED